MSALVPARESVSGAAAAVGELPPGRLVRLPAGRSVFVRDSAPSSSAPTVVLLHGLGVSADLNWFTAAPALNRGFRVVAPDLSGHGQTTRSSERFRLETAADDVAALADALALDPFIAVGYSMGGAVAQLVWQRHRALVRALVLCGTSRSFNHTPQERLTFWALPGIRAAARAIPAALTTMTVRSFAGAFLGRALSGLSDQVGRFDVTTVLEAASALGSYTSHKWISDVGVPTAVLVNLRDQIVPPGRQYGLAAAIRHAEVHLVEGDHFAPVRRPGEFTAALLAAVRSVDRRAVARRIGYSSSALAS